MLPFLPTTMVPPCNQGMPPAYEVLFGGAQLTTIVLNPWSIPDTTGSLHHHTPSLPTPYEVGSYLISSSVMRVSLPYPQGLASATPHQRHHTAELEHKPLGTRHSPIRSDLKTFHSQRGCTSPKASAGRNTQRCLPHVCITLQEPMGTYTRSDRLTTTRQKPQHVPRLPAMPPPTE